MPYTPIVWRPCPTAAEVSVPSCSQYERAQAVFKNGNPDTAYSTDVRLPDLSSHSFLYIPWLPRSFTQDELQRIKAMRDRGGTVFVTANYFGNSADYVNNLMAFLDSPLKVTVPPSGAIGFPAQEEGELGPANLGIPTAGYAPFVPSPQCPSDPSITPRNQSATFSIGTSTGTYKLHTGGNTAAVTGGTRISSVVVYNGDGATTEFDWMEYDATSRTIVAGTPNWTAEFDPAEFCIRPDETLTFAKDLLNW